MSHQIVEVDFLDPRAVALREAMIAERLELYGAQREDASGAAEEIDLDTVIVCLLVLVDGEPVGTATLRHLRDLVEIKRMYLLPGTRGTGLARRLLAATEERAAAVTDRVVLHTGERQAPAIALYRRAGYEPIEVYPPYDTVPESLCFTKDLGLRTHL